MGYDEDRDYLLANVHTPAKIQADCEAAERLGGDGEKIGALREKLRQTQYLGYFKFHRYPTVLLSQLKKKVTDPNLGMEELKKAAMQAAELSVRHEQRIPFFDQVIARDPKDAAGYLARAELRWALNEEAKLGKQICADDIWEKSGRPRAPLPVELLLNDSGPDRPAPAKPGSSGFGPGPGLSTELTLELVARQKPLDLVLSEHSVQKIREDWEAANRLAPQLPGLQKLLKALRFAK